MNEFFEIIFRTIFLYVFIIIVFRVMGRREVGELSVMDLAIFVLIAEVAAFALDGVDRNLFKAILPIVILLLLQIITSYISLKSKKFRDMIDGDPILIIEDGVILEKAMSKERYNLDDLLQQLREQSIATIKDVSFAYLEPSGNLSVYKKDEQAFAFPLIIDGEIQLRHLRIVKKDENWLQQQLNDMGYDDISTIFYCSLEPNDALFIQLKASTF